jgi:hypothetical protein
MSPNDYPPLVSADLACTIIGGDKPINKSTLYRGVKQGLIPAPIHPSPGISRWVTAELLAAIKRKAA